jgi:hypothetical protein
MDVSIKGVFESECADLAIDAQLAKRLHLYTVGFAHKNQDHIEFFGGNLTGVQVVRFTDADRDQWFHEILRADEGALEERLLALPTVNADFNVSSDTMNLSCAWLMHALLISKKLNDHQRHEAMMNVALVLQYKFLTSRLYRHFKYPADRATAEATYAALTYKYAIKQYGSWAAVLNARAEEIISPTGLHHQAIETMSPDSTVIYLLNDTQGRIRDMLKNIYDVFLQVHRQGIKISSTSSMVEHDGVEILKDKSKNLLAYTRYINSIITDRNSFIREELVTVIEKQMKTMPPRLFRESLEWMSDNYRQAGAGMIEELLNETLIHSFDYLAENRSLVRNSTDLASLLTRLRGVYMSSRSTDPALFSLREKAEKIVKLATQNKNTSVIAAVRTGILLYLIARAYSMRYYAQAAVSYPARVAA